MSQIRKLCVECGQEWPCKTAQDPQYFPEYSCKHYPILENDEPELEGYNNEYD